jgi:hypothetical protein
MTSPMQPTMTTAFYAQSVVSFAVSIGTFAVAAVYLPVDPWIRAFLIVTVLYAVTSAFTLAKCVRDRQETTNVASRVDQARLDKILVHHDPFKVEMPSS